MIILGIDPSLTSTGLAQWGHPPQTQALRIKGTGFTREDTLIGEILAWAEQWGGEPTLTVIEGAAFASGRHSSRGHAALVGFRWRLLRELCHIGAVLEVAPTMLKKFATGKGNATKDEMRGRAVLVRQHLGDVTATTETTGEDEADALLLGEVGAFWLAHRGKNAMTTSMPVDNEHHVYRTNVASTLIPHTDSMPLPQHTLCLTTQSVHH